MSGCQRCREAVSASLDGEDDARDRLMIGNHLDRCPECRGFADAARALADLTRRRSDEPDAVVVPSCSSGRAHLRPVGNAACGCVPDCPCGCQHGGACHCEGVAA